MLLPQLGTEHWLQLLLDVLEGDFVTAEDMGLAAPPPSADRIRYRTRKQRVKKRKKHKK